MKTIKYGGEVYEIIEHVYSETQRTSNVNILAGLNKDGIYRFLRFSATYFKELDNLDFCYEEFKWLTRYDVKSMSQFIEKEEQREAI